MNVRLVDIGGIDDHHCSSFLFIIYLFFGGEKVTFLIHSGRIRNLVTQERK
jgi:hypothetical protein